MYVWNKIKVLKNVWTKVSSPIWVSSSIDKLKIVLDTLTRAWVPTDPEWLPECQENDILSEPFQFTELNIALASRKNQSSPGPGGIDYEILRNLLIKHRIILLDMFNWVYSKNEYPEEWKKQYSRFIEKSDGVNFRLIALSSRACKLFETLIKTACNGTSRPTNFC